MAREITILKGHVSRDHVHLLVSAPPKLSVADLVQYLKGRSSHVLRRREFPELRRRRYWGRPLWARGHFAAASSGAVTDARVRAYIERQDMPPTDGFTVADDKL